MKFPTNVLNLTFSPNQRVFPDEFKGLEVEFMLKREDLIHPKVSGNKFRKLKYNIIAAYQRGEKTLLTFGGAYSNHVAATASAGKLFGFKTIGVIRGDELEGNFDNNPTLQYAKECGMEFHFLDREAYRNKHSEEILHKLRTLYGDFYLLPEGGTNALAIKGCEEILTDGDTIFDVICVPVGSGGTIAGIINSSLPHQKVIGFSSLKGNFLSEDVKKLTTKSNWEITDAYCFDGYAKINGELVNFINNFRTVTGILLDPIYTGKMVYGIVQMVKEGKIPKKSRILAIHTGGLQGIAGINQKLNRKGLPLITV